MKHAAATHPNPALELKSERVQRALQRLPGWKPTDDQQGLELALIFTDLPSAYAFISAFAELATERNLEGGQFVFLGNAVIVSLRYSETFQGVTAAQLAFAHQLNQRPERGTGRELAGEEEK